MIEEDNRLTYRIMRSKLGIGMTAIKKILHHYLETSKMSCRWIPNNLTDARKIQCVKK